MGGAHPLRQRRYPLLVEIGGRPFPPALGALLLEGYVDDSANVPDLFVLRYSDQDGTFLGKTGVRIGDAVVLSVQTSGPTGPERLLSGEVTALETDLISWWCRPSGTRHLTRLLRCQIY